LDVVGLRGVKLLGYADGEKDAAAAESTDAGGWIDSIRRLREVFSHG